MPDNDAKIIEDAAAAVTRIDLQYRAASFNDKLQLKDKRDEAFSNYAAARVKLLQDGVTGTDQDVADMKTLRTQVESAAKTQDLIVAAGKIALFLGKLALKA
jgi:hypothetical protein